MLEAHPCLSHVLRVPTSGDVPLLVIRIARPQADHASEVPFDCRVSRAFSHPPAHKATVGPVPASPLFTASIHPFQTACQQCRVPGFVPGGSPLDLIRLWPPHGGICPCASFVCWYLHSCFSSGSRPR